MKNKFLLLKIFTVSFLLIFLSGCVPKETPPSTPIIWQKTYGGSSDEKANSIQQVADGGYIVAGDTYSFGNSGDVYILKLKSDGSLDWYKTYGGSNYDHAYSIQQVADGGYIVAGDTYSFGTSVDVYILKLDKDGNTGPYPE